MTGSHLDKLEHGGCVAVGCYSSTGYLGMCKQVVGLQVVHAVL